MAALALVVGLAWGWGTPGGTAPANAQTVDETQTPTPTPVETPTPTATLAEATTSPAATGTATVQPTSTSTVAATATSTATPMPGCVEDPSDPEQADGASFQALIETLFTGSEYSGGPRNMVKLENKVSDRLRVKGNVQLNKIGDDTVTPFNYAIAYSACGVNSQTLAVALQLNVYRAGASDVRPQNYAVAVNYGCTHCAAVGYAVQLSMGVADPNVVPDEGLALGRELDAELRAIHAEAGSLSLSEAYARVVAAIDRFRGLPALINEAQDQLGG